MDKQDLVRTTITFAVIFTVGVLLIGTASQLVESDTQPVLYSIGSVLATAALAFFLIEAFRIDRESRS